MKQVRSALRELLLDHGFSPRVYDHELCAEYLGRLFQASAMPHFSSYGIDDETIYPDTMILLEVTPDEQIQLAAQDVDFFEEPVSIFQEAGLVTMSNAGLTPAQILATQ